VAKVCFVAPKAYPLFNPACKGVLGGAEVDLYLLATELAKDKDFTVSFITADYGQLPIETIAGVQIIKSLDFKKNVLSGVVRIWRAMRQADADIYLQKTSSWGTFFVAMFCILHKRVFVYRTATAGECDGTWPKRRLERAAFDWSLRRAGKILVQNETDQHNINALLGVSSMFIRNGHRIPPLTGSWRDGILWVGRSAREKKPELFIKLAQNFVNERFVMICQKATGDTAYETLVSDAAVVKNLEFVRHVDFNEMDGYFEKAKVFVNTSDFEGFPNTFIQAGKAGAAILSLNVNPDGFLDTYHCGKACDGDLAQCVDALQYMRSENRYVELGKNARAYAEAHHDITKIAAEYKKLLKDMLRSERWSECAE
jgi:glycosyltransferase involved in cell wall biosynthesis